MTASACVVQAFLPVRGEKQYRTWIRSGKVAQVQQVLLAAFAKWLAATKRQPLFLSFAWNTTDFVGYPAEANAIGL